MRSEKKNIVIIEPSAMFRDGLKAMFCRIGYNVVAEYSDVEALSHMFERVQADVLIINPELVTMPLHELLKKLPMNSTVPVFALVYQYFPPERLAVYDAVIDCRMSDETLGQMLDEQLGQTNKQKVNTENYELTDREKDVLILVAKGFMSKEIADKLNISVHTVISHRKNITRKTGIKSVAGLAVYAMLNNLMDNNE
ncbi:MAG TPA: DNA-binding response regulator [Bacteroidales bacterium]|nr:DNA-binding response regulator [Bacteroidales bacterium]